VLPPNDFKNPKGRGSYVTPPDPNKKSGSRDSDTESGEEKSGKRHPKKKAKRKLKVTVPEREPAREHDFCNPNMLSALLGIPIQFDNDDQDSILEDQSYMLCQPCNVNKSDIVHDLDHMFSEADANGMRYMTLINNKNSTMSNVRLKVLFDTGALGKRANYISKEAAKKLKEVGYVAHRTNKVVCSCFVGSNKVITEFYKIRLRFYDETVKANRTFTLKCDVIDTPHDVIIGFDTIRRCRVLREIVLNGLLNTSRHTESRSKAGNVEGRETENQGDTTHEDVTGTDTLNTSDESSYSEERLDRNPFDMMMPNDNILSASTARDEYIPPKIIEGDEELVDLITRVCDKCYKVFSEKLNIEPAKITPMELELIGTWLSKENQLPPRNQSYLKCVETENQTKKMLESGVISPSRAAAHSQVMLTVKPDGTWRFCVDYRRLNVVTKPNNWPLPKIKEMLERLGKKKANYFGVIDLTKGYYQAPLHPNSRHLSAYITPQGLYEWNRVAMGLRGAAGYFQRAMATEVLNGLVGVICEVYLDDIIIHGVTKEEFVKNLETVLMRLQAHNITVNPNKCKLGLTSVEYVGHLIDQTGCHFTREKLQKVINFPVPQKEQELKSFLGLTNFFRDNVRNYAATTAPLQAMMRNYNPKRKLDWDGDPGRMKAFLETQKLVNECPKLFWVDDDADSEIHLYTDASKLGIGAYLCQRLADGTEHPIGFFSKSLSGAEKNWGVPELEGYAIYAAFKEFDYLLRDIHTFVHTDHKNLTYIRDTGSEKVIRWKMHLQEYSFDLAFIAGVDNPIADYLSRNEAADQTDYVLEAPNKVANMLCSMYVCEDNKAPYDTHQDEYSLNTSSWSTWTIPDDKYKMLKSVHNCIAGHHGVDTTLRKLSRQGLKWKGMREHTRRYIKECDTCQKHSYRQFKVNVPKFVTGRINPMEKISIDTIGPLPKDREGNEYALVIIDMFSRWMTIYPTKTVSAEEAAKVLLHHVGTFGVPAQIQSDNGSQFVNELIMEFLETIGSEHITGIAYSKQEQGIVERANGKIGNWVRHLIYDKKLEKTLWSEYLPFVQRLHNASEVHSTGYAPCQILFGDQVKLDRSILLPEAIRNTPDSQTLNEWMKVRSDMQKEILHHAQHAHIEHAEQSDFMNAVNNKFTEFEVGSYVLMSYPESGFGPNKPTKLHMMHKGPYKVLGHEGQEYKLKNLVNEKVEYKVIHLLRPYYYDKVRTDPADIARKDHFDQFYIEKVLGHTGKKSRKSSLQFRIKWLGYADETTEPWANVRLNSTLHEYLRNNKMENLIPKDDELEPEFEDEHRPIKEVIPKPKKRKAPQALPEQPIRVTRSRSDKT
jgi:hypothetical protein